MRERVADGPGRRPVLTGASLALAASLAACTRGRGPTAPAGPPPAGSAPAGTTVAGTTATGSAAATGTGSAALPTGAASTSAAVKPTLAALSRQLSTPLLQPKSADFAAAARLYNPRFDSAPAPTAIARCRSTADVAAGVRFAAATGTPLSVRAGGHSYGGWSRGSGLMLDVAPLRTVSVDTAGGTAKIGAGATLVDVYAALANKNVAIAAGSCPTVGVTGLLLGGGVGALTRAYGLTCDALRAATVVTADGKIHSVDPAHDPGLFWALQGGGGGFTAVVDLTLAVRAAPTVHTFYLQWDFSHAEAVLSGWQQWIGKTDRALWSTCKLLADPGAGLRATVSGTWIGAGPQLQAVLDPLLKAIGAPTTANQRNTLDYASAMLLEAGCSGQSPDQCRADALSPHKRQPFAATSAVLDSPLPSTGVSTAVAQARSALSIPGLVEGGVSFDALGGAVADIAPTATAFAHRGALALVQYTATWSAAAADPAPYDRFVRGERAALSRWTGDGAYVNYADPSIGNYPAAYWGANYPRLQAVKKQYDPGNLFSFAQSVKA